MSNTEKQWYLKKKNNALYGPVSLDELALWAQQCRITAGNQASTDQKEWIAVQDIPALAMDWLAMRSDGKQYGPFPISAIPELVKHNVLPADAILTHRHTSETMNMSDIQNTKQNAPQPPSAGQETEPQADMTQDALHKLRLELDHTRKQMKITTQQAEEQQVAMQTRIDTLQDALAQAHEQNNAIQTDENTFHDTIDELRQQIAFMKKNNAALNAQILTVRHTADQRARMLTLAWVAVTLSIAIVIVMLLGGGSRQATQMPNIDDTTENLSPDDSDAENIPPIINQNQPDTDTGSGIALSSTLPLGMNIPGITRTTMPNNNQLITFDEGIFSSLDTLSTQGRQQLDAIARQLPRNLAGWKLIIHGHTDNIPMRNTSQFADNAALARARADAAARHITQRAGFPAHAIAARAGETAPFSNDNAQNRIRNRTVTIEIKALPANE